MRHEAFPVWVFVIPLAFRRLLASPVSFFSWGFLYPVFIHAHGSGSRIEVGIQSKFFQIGPVVTKWHRDCVAAIEQAVSLPEARVV